MKLRFNRPFPSFKKSHFQSEAKCETIDMKMSFNYDANKTYFHNKGFALSLVLKVRFFGTRKWPIARFFPTFALTAVTTNTRNRRVFFFCSLFTPEFSRTSIKCFHGFPSALTEKVPSSLKEGRRLTRKITNDEGVFHYSIKMKDYIVRTTRSLRAE